MMKRTVLIPLDGSAYSREIVSRVCRVLNPHDYHCILLTVGEPVRGVTAKPPRPVSSDWPDPVYERARDIEFARHPIYETQAEASERDALEHELYGDRHRLEEFGFSVEIDVRFGEPASTIIATAEERNVDLIAMATRGSSGLRGLLLGSVAERVLQGVGVPLLLARPFDGEKR